MKKIVLILILLMLNSIVVSAQIYTDYKSNLKFEYPSGWEVFSDDVEQYRAIGIIDINDTNNRIIIAARPIPEFQLNSKFYNGRTLLDWNDNDLSGLVTMNANRIKEENQNNIILSSKLITSRNNKSIFIMYDNDKGREISAYTLINGIRYDTFISLDAETKQQKTETILPIFLDVVKSLRTAY